jgi:hypothetical protein
MQEKEEVLLNIYLKGLYTNKNRIKLKCKWFSIFSAFILHNL